jgi:hypothetical protein
MCVSRETCPTIFMVSRAGIDAVSMAKIGSDGR